MKLYQILFFLGSIFCLQILQGQTIVSTSPQLRNVVIEEFGGIYCVWCPDGHQIIKDLKNDYPEKIVHLNFQTGDYAVPFGNAPDFRTDFAPLLLEQSGTSGYPSATIDRKIFYGLEQGAPGTTAISRWNWETAISQEIDDTAPVNIAATASINTETNVLEVYVEYYYTASSSFPNNKLQVAILQNELLGPQIGGGLGDEYPQDNLFRNFITGQWGEFIAQTSEGTFGSRTFSYLLPDAIRDIPLDPFNLKIAVFISEDHNDILNGIEIAPSFQFTNELDAHILSMKTPDFICQAPVELQIKVRNEGNTPISSFVINYAIENGEHWSYPWQGSLLPTTSTTISLPEIPIEELLMIPAGDSILFTSDLSAPNDLQDENLSNNEVAASANIAPRSMDNQVILSMQTDQFGFDTYWEVLDDNGVMLYNGGNPLLQGTEGGEQIAQATDVGAYGNFESIIEYIDLPQEGCYTFKIIDDYGDGLCCNNGWGYYTMTTSEGEVIFQGGPFRTKEEKIFNYDSSTTTAADELSSENKITLSPNPVNNGRLQYDIQVQNEASQYIVQISDLSGKTLLTKTEMTLMDGVISGQFDVGHLPNGIYFFLLKSATQSISQRFIIIQ